MSTLGEIAKKNMKELLPNAFDGEVMKSDAADLKAKQEASLKAYGEKLNAPVVFKEYTAEEIYQVIEADPRIKIDSYNKRVIKLLCLYFTSDPRFIENGGDLKKGILLSGYTGVGKTYLMNFFRRNMNHCYEVIPCAVVADEYAAKGRGIVGEKYSKLKDITPSAANFGKSKSGICFDDLGQEPETRYYAEAERIMTPVLEARYRMGEFRATHLTTNLTADMIGQTYSERVRSRMAEMFNVIVFPEGAPDRRRAEQ